MPQCRSSTPCLCWANASAEACGTLGLSGTPFPSHQLPSAAPFLQSVAVSATCQCLGGDEPLLPLPEVVCSLVDVAHELTRWRGGEQQLQVFSGALREALAEHYKHHWFPEKPFKGSGYRCIRINHKMDPIISKAASQIGLSLPQLYQLLPSELTLWVDPYEVSYRIGEDGSICVLYEATATKPVSSYGMLTCKNQMMLGRTSPSKNYIMTVSS
uniref:BTG anti-proliferation factor 2 n=1 Tax=Buteo japonicus TaxID=224669 RepID=A0A8C0C3G5_9AVES